MAIIDNQAPVPPSPPPSQPAGRRVVVKLRGAPPPTFSATVARESAMQSLVQGLSGATVRPYFDEPSPPPAGAAMAAAAAQPVFRSYVVIEPPAGADAIDLARTLNERADVEIAYVEGGPTPPPVNPANNPLSGNHGYLAAAPGGIDAYWAWGHADGSGIDFVDLEQGWTLNHEDLAAAAICVISGVNLAYTGHGTAVLGEVVGVDNFIGVVGIAPSARARVVSQWRTAANYQTADAIRSAMSAMRAGDVLLLEAQTTYPPGTDLLPVEVEQAVYDAIPAATDAGIVVIEAGGNGAVDLDQFQDVRVRRILENVQSTGDGWTGNALDKYTPGFGGTSGASPIVTGAALLLQAWALGRRYSYPPHTLRALLSDPAHNTASASPTVDRIGVMPNLKAIITRELGLGTPALADAGVTG